MVYREPYERKSIGNGFPFKILSVRHRSGQRRVGGSLLPVHGDRVLRVRALPGA